MTIKRSFVVLVAAASLAACNDGTVPDKHAITFESQVPAGGPSRVQAEAALKRWLLHNVPDGPSARDITVGPVRYASVLFPFPEKDYFVCARFTAKNRFGTYEPPQEVIMTTRVYEPAEGWAPSLVKGRRDASYRQYCIGQPHE
ncbi:hypothetical protein [Ruegeria sp. HKCCD8929]|uniref:hypothetical protein n=1 Tax=Ruegeria sp. HKCCD8929 TaxID=2683006 RepID=UPI00148890E8|nr:hypothetical protein [Ruegeria sp. HKCCD8929]